MRGGLLRSTAPAILIGIFALALAPRELFHRCDQRQVSHQHPASAAINGDLDCEVCSVVVATVDDHIVLPLVPEAAGFATVVAGGNVDPTIRSLAVDRSRGPPSC